MGLLLWQIWMFSWGLWQEFSTGHPLWFYKINLSAEISNTWFWSVREHGVISAAFSPSSCGQKAVKEFELRLNRKVLEVWSCSYLPLLCACIHHPSQQRSTGCHHGLQSQSASEQKKNHMPPPLNFGSERGCCGRSTLDFSWLSFDILILKPSPRILH